MGGPARHARGGARLLRRGNLLRRGPRRWRRGRGRQQHRKHGGLSHLVGRIQALPLGGSSDEPGPGRLVGRRDRWLCDRHRRLRRGRRIDDRADLRGLRSGLDRPAEGGTPRQRPVLRGGGRVLQVHERNHRGRWLREIEERRRYLGFSLPGRKGVLRQFRLFLRRGRGGTVFVCCVRVFRRRRFRRTRHPRCPCGGRIRYQTTPGSVAVDGTSKNRKSQESEH
mmetsp:Transcript_22284/g.49430  ORF Transcript_22284/g.49430 Transcript_22284/m.49430 type:complete len:224 (+) Transcript_22284:490-1161(+)